MGDPPLKFEDGAVRGERQRQQCRLLLGKSLIDDAMGGRMPPAIGNRVEPVPELKVEIVQVFEGTCEEEVLTDIAEWPLHLALGFGTIGPAGARLEAIMPRQIDQAAVIDDGAFAVLAKDGRLHPVVENLSRHPADRLQGRDVAAQNRLQVLVDDEARPDQP